MVALTPTLKPEPSYWERALRPFLSRGWKTIPNLLSLLSSKSPILSQQRGVVICSKVRVRLKTRVSILSVGGGRGELNCSTLLSPKLTMNGGRGGISNFMRGKNSCVRQDQAFFQKRNCYWKIWSFQPPRTSVSTSVKWGCAHHPSETSAQGIPATTPYMC